MGMHAYWVMGVRFLGIKIVSTHSKYLLIHHPNKEREREGGRGRREGAEYTKEGGTGEKLEGGRKERFKKGLRGGGEKGGE